MLHHTSACRICSRPDLISAGFHSPCRSAPDLSLYLSLAILTGWQHTYLSNASLAATLLLPTDAAVRAFLQQQASLAGHACRCRHVMRSCSARCLRWLVYRVDTSDVQILGMAAAELRFEAAGHTLEWPHLLHSGSVRPRPLLLGCLPLPPCCTATALCPPPSLLHSDRAVPPTLFLLQALTPENVYATSGELESLLAYHTLPTPLT